MPTNPIRRVAVAYLLMLTVLLGIGDGVGATTDRRPATRSEDPVSVVEVVARGVQGTEEMELRINGTVAETWTNVATTLSTYRHEVRKTTTIETITVHFTNDGGWPEADRNLIVDHLTIDGTTYESEAPTTWSNGSWNPANGCLPGIRQSEWLHCADAWFEYSDAAGTQLTASRDEGANTEIVVRASGTTGTEDIALSINDVVVVSWPSIPADPTDHRFEVDAAVTIDELRVHFVNNAHTDAGDRNVTIDHLRIGATVFESEAAENPSLGNWTVDNGCGEGFKQTEVLHCNGWISFAGARGLEVGPQPTPPRDVPTVIFDTDLGPDIDDALALAMLHAYESEGRAKLAAVTVSRNSIDGARFADLTNTFYGRPDLPVGIYQGSTPLDSADHNWSRPVAESGRYPHDVHLTDIPSGSTVMRQVLADADDNSVVLIQTGLSANTAALLASEPDEISPLSGRELAARKVRLLSIMAGNNEHDHPEFNVRNHVESAQSVFGDWPTEIIQSEGSLGYGIHYPLTSIEQDFDYVIDHPIKEAYLTTDLPWHQEAGDYYNMRTWDLHSVLAGLESNDRYYRVGVVGIVSVDDDGRTTFSENPDGNARSLGYYWQYSSLETERMVARMIETVSRPPDHLP